MDTKDQKPITLDDLATMVAGGFNDVITRIDKVEVKLEKVEVRLEKVEQRMDNLDQRMSTVEHQMSDLNHRMEALNSNVNNYVELAEKRHFESKERDSILTRGLKLVAEKTNTPIDVSQLEKI